MQIKKTNQNDIEALMEIRLEMLRVVNGLDENVAFDKILVDTSREYFLNGDRPSQ